MMPAWPDKVDDYECFGAKATGNIPLEKVLYSKSYYVWRIRLCERVKLTLDPFTIIVMMDVYHAHGTLAASPMCWPYSTSWTYMSVASQNDILPNPQQVCIASLDPKQLWIYSRESTQLKAAFNLPATSWWRTALLSTRFPMCVCPS